MSVDVIYENKQGKECLTIVADEKYIFNFNIVQINNFWSKKINDTGDSYTQM